MGHDALSLVRSLRFVHKVIPRRWGRQAERDGLALVLLGAV